MVLARQHGLAPPIRAISIPRGAARFTRQLPDWYSPAAHANRLLGTPCSFIIFWAILALAFATAAFNIYLTALYYHLSRHQKAAGLRIPRPHNISRRTGGLDKYTIVDASAMCTISLAPLVFVLALVRASPWSESITSVLETIVVVFAGAIGGCDLCLRHAIFFGPKHCAREGKRLLGAHKCEECASDIEDEVQVLDMLAKVASCMLLLVPSSYPAWAVFGATTGPLCLFMMIDQDYAELWRARGQDEDELRETVPKIFSDSRLGNIINNIVIACLGPWFIFVGTFYVAFPVVAIFATIPYVCLKGSPREWLWYVLAYSSWCLLASCVQPLAVETMWSLCTSQKAPPDLETGQKATMVATVNEDTKLLISPHHEYGTTGKTPRPSALAKEADRTPPLNDSVAILHLDNCVPETSSNPRTLGQPVSKAAPTCFFFVFFLTYCTFFILTACATNDGPCCLFAVLTTVSSWGMCVCIVLMPSGSAVESRQSLAELEAGEKSAMTVGVAGEKKLLADGVHGYGTNAEKASSFTHVAFQAPCEKDKKTE